MSNIDVMLKMLTDMSDSIRRMERNQRALRPVLEAFHRSATLTEECLESVACDAAQARHNGHKMNNLAQSLAVGVDLLLDIADGKKGSSDSIKAARDGIREASNSE